MKLFKFSMPLAVLMICLLPVSGLAAENRQVSKPADVRFSEGTINQLSKLSGKSVQEVVNVVKSEKEVSGVASRLGLSKEKVIDAVNKGRKPEIKPSIAPKAEQKPVTIVRALKDASGKTEAEVKEALASEKEIGKVADKLGIIRDKIPAIIQRVNGTVKKVEPKLPEPKPEVNVRAKDEARSPILVKALIDTSGKTEDEVKAALQSERELGKVAEKLGVTKEQLATIIQQLKSSVNKPEKPTITPKIEVSPQPKPELKKEEGKGISLVKVLMEVSGKSEEEVKAAIVSEREVGRIAAKLGITQEQLPMLFQKLQIPNRQPEVKPEQKPEIKPEQRPEVKPEVKKEEGKGISLVKALMEISGKSEAEVKAVLSTERELGKICTQLGITEEQKAVLFSKLQAK